GRREGEGPHRDAGVRGPRLTAAHLRMIGAMGTPSDVGALWQQVAWLLILPIPIASISWTVTHEELFRELRDYCTGRSQACRSLLQRKFFYIVTCEYCFSHWV